jgi:hypothetical protein
MALEKYLYCPKCKTFPDDVDEIYEAGVVEERRWTGSEYEVQESMWPPYESVCKCGTELEDRSVEE